MHRLLLMYSVALFVSKQSCGNLNSAVFITDANKGFLASSVVLWVFSVVLTIIGPVAMAVRKGKICIQWNLQTRDTLGTI